MQLGKLRLRGWLAQDHNLVRDKSHFQSWSFAYLPGISTWIYLNSKYIKLKFSTSSCKLAIPPYSPISVGRTISPFARFKTLESSSGGKAGNLVLASAFHYCVILRESHPVWITECLVLEWHHLFTSLNFMIVSALASSSSLPFKSNHLPRPVMYSLFLWTSLLYKYHCSYCFQSSQAL